MLVLSRKKNESILIGDNIRIICVECTAGKTRIGIEAPKDIVILREELKDKCRKGDQNDGPVGVASVPR